MLIQRVPNKEAYPQNRRVRLFLMTIGTFDGTRAENEPKIYELEQKTG